MLRVSKEVFAAMAALAPLQPPRQGESGLRRLRSPKAVELYNHTDVLPRGKSEFDAFEKLVKTYEDQSGDTVAGTIKQATVLNGLANERLLEHLQLSAEKFDTSVQMRVMITNYFTMRRTWSGPTPMDIGALGGWGGGKDGWGGGPGGGFGPLQSQ